MTSRRHTGVLCTTACIIALAGNVTATRAQEVGGPDATEATAAGTDRGDVIVLIGAPGIERFGAMFAEAAAAWRDICERGGQTLTMIGPASRAGGEAAEAAADLAEFDSAIASVRRDGPAALWIVMVGHGTFDGRAAKFNLRGPDLTVEHLAALLEGFSRPIVVVNGAAASVPFLTGLSGPGRLVVSATKAPTETSVARFGTYFAEAMRDPEADLDKDGQTSLLEGFLTASRRVDRFYESEGRLATERALLDDNGDGLGTRADFFRGVRPVKDAAEGRELDGYRAQQLVLIRSAQERAMPAAARARRDGLELQVIRLRDRSDEMTDAAYLAALEPLLLELAELYERHALPEDADGDSTHPPRSTSGRPNDSAESTP